LSFPSPIRPEKGAWGKKKNRGGEEWRFVHHQGEAWKGGMRKEVNHRGGGKVKKGTSGNVGAGRRMPISNEILKGTSK